MKRKARLTFESSHHNWMFLVIEIYFAVKKKKISLLIP
jgi:hypothetical protein